MECSWKVPTEVVFMCVVALEAKVIIATKYVHPLVVDGCCVTIALTGSFA